METMQPTTQADASETQEKHTSQLTGDDVDVPDNNDHLYDDNADEATRLASLATGMRDQDDLERDIGRQADAMLLEQAVSTVILGPCQSKKYDRRFARIPLSTPVTV